MDNNENERGLDEQLRLATPEASTRRILMEWGMQIEAFGEAVRLREDQPRQVYNIQLRAITRNGQDVLMLVKAVGEEGPLIAFHSGTSMRNAILTWPARLNAGRIAWREDEYPPDKYDEIKKYINSELEYYAKH